VERPNNSITSVQNYMSISNEKIILVSNDSSISLTSHRVIQRERNLHKEINLVDFSSYSVIKKRYKYYKILSLIFGIIAAILIFFVNTSSEPSSYDDSERNGEIAVIVFIPVFLTLISILLLFTTSEKYMKISGKFNSIEFSIKKLSNTGLTDFLNTLSVESENRKRSEQ
jgi:uncharacterized membrane protein